MICADGLGTSAACGLAIAFAAPAVADGRVSVVTGCPITVAAEGALKPTFEAVPLGKREEALDRCGAVSLRLAAAGLAIAFATGLAMAAAGWPITVAAAGAFNPIFEAVPLGRLERDMGSCSVWRPPFSVTGAAIGFVCGVGLEYLG